MASVQKRGNKYQLRVKNKLLPRPFFFTFDTEAEALGYGDQLEALLARGVVPQEMLAAPAARGDDPKLVDLIDEYKRTQPVTDSDAALLDIVARALVGLRVSGVTFLWAEKYVKDLKVSRNLAPGSIRKRIGTLARVLDWHWLRVADKNPDNGNVRANPLRLLPDGYSAYSRIDRQAVKAAGGEAKVDVSRERRLAPAEEQRVRLALSGVKRDDKERALPVDPDLTMLFDLILDTGLRLREAYRLRLDQFDLERGIIHVEGSKGRRGVIKPRVVPLKRELRERLKKWLKGKGKGLVFPFWDGQPESLANTTSRLSSRFRTLFDYAGVEDFTEHDLRHEATCRWFELKKPRVGWVFSDLEICKIMGWTTTKMALRYLSLRGEDLANRLL
jgi:integrase